MRPINADKIPWFIEGVGEIPVVTKDEIDAMPTVYKENIVHCNDCIYFEHKKYPLFEADLCTLLDRGVRPKRDFCSWGERWEE